MKQQQRQKRLLQQSKQQQQQRQQKWLTLISKVSYFVLGCLLSSIVILNYQALQLQQNHHHHHTQQQNNLREGSSNFLQQQQGKRRKRFTTNHNHNNNTDDEEVTSGAAEVSSQKLLEEKEESSSSSSLQVPFSRLRVLVALVAYDFSQIPHLEEVLDSYSDLSLAVSNVTVIIYTTIPWPVTYIDMMETRFSSSRGAAGGGNFQIQIYVFSPSLRLYLVNEHRHKFYEDIENYDLFIYSEDDILIPPTTIATYYDETLRISNPTTSGVVFDEKKTDPQHTKPSDFNIGLVRYEYQFPPNVLIDDGTRHVTQNVSRIYWEHVKNEPAYEGIQSLSILSSSTTSTSSSTTTTKTNSDYVTMKNHHQGCYIATRDLLKAWKTKCEFHIPSNRPGTNSQPAEGTQRVWISSNQLFGKRHCNVQQVLPIEKFGALTIWHLPNKNYRRIGRKGRIGGKQGGPPQDKTTTATATTTATTKQIPTALKWHLEFRQNFPPPKNPQRRMPGIITMEDHVHGPGSNSPLLKRRINEYNDYIERGRILSEEDMKHTELVETS